MAFYTPEEVEKMRENVRRGLNRGRSTPGKKPPINPSGVWEPDYSLHDKLGLPRPPVMTKSELDTILTRRPGGTPANDSPGRLVSIWDPYVEAEVARVADLMQDAESDERVFSILGGSSATMKSTFRRWAEGVVNGTVDKDSLPGDAPFVLDYLDGRSVMVDPDDAKLIIPEYIGHISTMTPGGASYVHQESRNIAEQLRRRAAESRLPIIYDTSGQFNNGNQTISDMRDSGYRISANYFLAPTDILIQRAQEREEATGRGVPTGIISTMADNLTRIIPNLWSGGWFDDLTLIDTSDPLNPRIILRLSLAEDLQFEQDETALISYFGRDRMTKWWKQLPSNAKW
jgi:hypothetical protein